MKFIFKHLLNHKAILFTSSLAAISVIGIDSLMPYIQKIIVDDSLLGDKINLFIPLILSLLIISIFKAILGYVKEFGFDKLSAKAHQDIKIDLFNHIQSLEFAYFDDMNTGELMARIGEDIDIIWQTISFGMRLLVENIIYFIISAIILFSLSFKLSLVCMIVMLPIGYITIKLESKFMNCYEDISDQVAKINTTAQENIAGVRLVKAFNKENFEIKKFFNLNKTYYDLNMNQAKIIGNYFPPIEFLTNVSLVMMIIFGGALVINNEISIGTLVAFSGYIWNLIWPMRMLGSLINLLAQNKASTKKILKILNQSSKIHNSKDKISPEFIKGNIKFSNVYFKYEDKPVLKNINLTIPQGSTVAIMGTTGSGKSSLLNLIGRYYDCSEGTVFIDNIDIKNLDLQILRKNMAVVSQDIFLFSDTIKNNITFGNENASMEEIQNICNTCCCYDFINDLPEHFNTEIGERGLGLSGGQKQRISIARALIRKAPILILDDATSALDMETEYNLLKNLSNSKYSCTTFIVAHRISAVKNCDLILYLENGEIVEQGTHEDLINKKGRYFEIYCHQFKDFKMLESEVG